MSLGMYFIQVRSVGCDLSKQPETYLPDIEKATEDVMIQCIFCNAGYIKTGFFDSTTLGASCSLAGIRGTAALPCRGVTLVLLLVTVCADAQLANLHCNATSSVAVAHHFIRRLRKEEGKPRGCVVFTSSPAMLMPCPFSCMYGATKAFITSLATSMSAEVCVCVERE